MTRTSVINIVYMIILVLSAYGSYTASQIDAPYGIEAGLESTLYSIGGGLMLYSVIPLIVKGKSGIRTSTAALIIGIIMVSLDYTLYTGLYQNYVASTQSFHKYLAMAPLVFVITAIFGILWIMARLGI